MTGSSGVRRRWWREAVGSSEAGTRRASAKEAAADAWFPGWKPAVRRVQRACTATGMPRTASTRPAGIALVSFPGALEKMRPGRPGSSTKSQLSRGTLFVGMPSSELCWGSGQMQLQPRPSSPVELEMRNAGDLLARVWDACCGKAWHTSVVDSK